MSPSSPVAAPPSVKLTLTIVAADAAAEIFVVNGDFYLVDRAVGSLVTKPLDPGIYKVKAKINQQTWEQHVTLTQANQTVTIPPFRFASAAPLDGTAKTHEYQIAGAQAESGKVHLSLGQGSCIFLFAREWTSSTSGPPQVTNPILGLTLHNADEVQLADIAAVAHVDFQNLDAWGACNIAVNPGIYILRLTLPSGVRHERTIVAASGWQTQVFLFLCDYAGVRAPDIVRGAVLMSAGMGFAGSEVTFRQIETARMALANERKILKGELRAMLSGKIANPMLGILSGHLLLLDPSPDLSLLGIVVNNLRSLVGATHPDVEALALAAGLGSVHLFAVPPMLRRSWALVVDATVAQPALVPSGSVADRGALSQWSVEPWLAWEVKSVAAAAVEDVSSTVEDFTEALRLQSFAAPAVPPDISQRESAFEAVRTRRSSATPEGSVMSVAFSVPAPAAAANLDPSKMGQLVRALGLPRSTIEGMVSQMNANITAPATLPSTQTRWCFAWPAGQDAAGHPDRKGLLKALQWNAGEVISISFLDGDQALQERVKHAALTWTRPTLARLTFDFRQDTTETLIRISFQYPGSWSAIGTTCRQILDQKKPTMNFGWLKMSSTDDEVRSIVLHEFGHALGMIHENEGPQDREIQWNRDAVSRDLSSGPNQWPSGVIESNIFKAFEAKESNFTSPDPNSIMTSPIPPEWTVNGVSAGLNKDLSARDMEFIRSQYP